MQKIENKQTRAERITFLNLYHKWHMLLTRDIGIRMILVNRFGSFKLYVFLIK